jgi:hypothetical protein
MTTPEWLSKRGGTLSHGSDDGAWFVGFNQQVQYELSAVPVAGKFGCTITQAQNGQRIASSTTYASSDDAILGGLEELRKHLGW